VFIGSSEFWEFHRCVQVRYRFDILVFWSCTSKEFSLGESPVEILSSYFLEYKSVRRYLVLMHFVSLGYELG
jgi:hypothetical protein